MIKHAIKRILLSMGYEIHKINKSGASCTTMEAGFAKALGIVRPYTMLNNSRLYSLYRQAIFCENLQIPGDYVECGVWKGGAVALMALANLNCGTTRRDIHLFDAFDHICEPDSAHDGARALAEVQQWAKKGGADGRLAPLEGFYDEFGGAGSVEGNKELLEKVVGYDISRLHFHKGWFQDTIPEDAEKIEKIAILRIDGDWYASTKVCLDFLFDKVVSGGFIIVDDYGAYDGCRKAVDEYLSAKKLPIFMNQIDNEAIYFIAP